MTQRICHLCGIVYEDNPYFKEQPTHTPEKCLDILRFKLQEAELNVSEVEQSLKRAELEYKA